MDPKTGQGLRAPVKSSIDAEGRMCVYKIGQGLEDSCVQGGTQGWLRDLCRMNFGA